MRKIMKQIKFELGANTLALYHELFSQLDTRLCMMLRDQFDWQLFDELFDYNINLKS
jgi:hypothetical protein